MEDTIAAVATAPGEAGIGIVRLSGENVLQIINDIFKPKSKKSISAIDHRKLIYGHIIDNKQVIDEVLVVYMKAPHTYTKEDIAEIHCHGGMIPVRKILELTLKKGARLAEKGEFTKRAFLNGRIDLSQAEAVMDIISAKTDKGFDLALNQLEGQLSENIRQIRNALLQTIAHVSVNIDYPEEDIEEITYENLKKQISDILSSIKNLLETADTGKIIKDGLNTVIIGRPNVGKSSLLNALLKESRAIVTEIPGTTRDIIEEMLHINGIPLKIIDTAGIRETSDVIEKIGVEKTKKSFNMADLIIFMLNTSEPLASEDHQIIELLKHRKAIVVLNKTDLPQKINIEEIQSLLPDKKIIQASMKQGKGIKELEEAISDMVYSGHVSQKNTLMITNIRHKNLLEKAKTFLEDSLSMIERQEPLDFIDIDLKNAWESLGEIIGEAVAEDIIDEIFSRFCLGK
ncbi:MAG: tRNA uridine-5-carboxymethylaminomethyl(34) synthesis GTPase MnmE [Clostridiales bacterium]|nr:tRNA uridine-5-carboxymethylaminomethyl(34) synthesis GTPase MnmE [Clostridiales bacterium]